MNFKDFLIFYWRMSRYRDRFLPVLVKCFQKEGEVHTSTCNSGKLGHWCTSTVKPLKLWRFHIEFHPLGSRKHPFKIFATFLVFYRKQIVNLVNNIPPKCNRIKSTIKIILTMIESSRAFLLLHQLPQGTYQ